MYHSDPTSTRTLSQRLATQLVPCRVARAVDASTSTPGNAAVEHSVVEEGSVGVNRTVVRTAVQDGSTGNDVGCATARVVVSPSISSSLGVALVYSRRRAIPSGRMEIP